MENIMNFLAKNYIWFFVVAGVLSFALIGFIFDSKKKKNNEFKGEELSKDASPLENSSENVMPIESTTISESPVEKINEVSPVEMVDGPVYESEPIASEQVTNDFEINDIPMRAAEEPIFNETPVNPELNETNTYEDSLDNSRMSFGEAISYDSNVNNNIVNDNSQEETNTFEELK